MRGLPESTYFFLLLFLLFCLETVKDAGFSGIRPWIISAYSVAISAFLARKRGA